MSFKIRPGEQIVFEGHPSWRSIIAFYLKGIGITAALVVALILIDRIDDWIATGVILAVLLIGAAVTALAGFIRRVATRYTITNRRLHIKHGIVSREVQETRLERVQDVSYSQSVIQRLLQVGDIDFDTASDDPTDFVFVGVDEPQTVVDAVYRATQVGGSSAGLGDEEDRPSSGQG